MAAGAAFTMCLITNVFILTLSTKLKQPRCPSMKTRLHEKKINATAKIKKTHKCVQQKRIHMNLLDLFL